MTLDLPPDAESRLAELAARTGKSTATFARDLLLDHLEQEEDIGTAEDRLRALEAGERTIPLNDVLAKYGMAD